MRISDWSSDVCSSDLKDVESVQAFGTELDPYAPRYEWTNHSIHGRPQHLERYRLRIGGEDCAQPYSAQVFNISAMSIGSLSGNAIQATKHGAMAGSFSHATGGRGNSYDARGGGKEGERSG